MSSPGLLRVKWVVRNISRMTAMRMLVKVLKMETADEISEFMHHALIDAGLGRVLGSYEGPEVG